MRRLRGRRGGQSNKNTDNQVKTRSSRNSTKNIKSTDQPSIQESISNMAAIDVVPETNKEKNAFPATNEDVKLILQRLDGMEKRFTDNLNSIKTSFEKKVDEIDKKYAGLYDSLKSDVSRSKEEVQEVKAKVTEVEKGLDFQGDEIKDLKTMETRFEEKLEEKIKTLESQFESKLKATTEIHKETETKLQNKILEMEKYGRKYNLLLYGVPEPTSENIFDTIRNFFKTDLKLDPDTVDNMYFHNAHRLPNKSAAHNPIIVKFCHYPDRELIFSKASVLPAGKRILSDLPVPLKQERHRLAQIAYDLRHSSDHFKTRIVEDGIKLRLQVRKSVLDAWENKIV